MTCFECGAVLKVSALRCAGCQVEATRRRGHADPKIRKNARPLDAPPRFRWTLDEIRALYRVVKGESA